MKLNFAFSRCFETKFEVLVNRNKIIKSGTKSLFSVRCKVQFPPAHLASCSVLLIDEGR
jgi:hypothetical protein